jgi:hypothetical protein
MFFEVNMNKFQVQGKTKLIKNSILNPENAGLIFILSTANLAGKPEGALMSIFDKKWVKVRQEAKGWFATKTGAYKLGAINTTAVQSNIWVTHMLCQNEDLSIDVKAVEECIKKAASSAKYEKASIAVSTLLTDAIPELGELIKKYMLDEGISVSFYEEPVKA